MFDPALDEIEDDPDLRNAFLSAYYESFQHPNNLEQMYGSDLFWWVLNVLDAKITGEYNSSADSHNNSGKKPSKIKTKIQKIDSFKFLEGVAPIRWQNVFKSIKDNRAKDIIEKKPIKMTGLDMLISEHKKQRQLREKTE